MYLWGESVERHWTSQSQRKYERAKKKVDQSKFLSCYVSVCNIEYIYILVFYFKCTIYSSLPPVSLYRISACKGLV